MTSPTVRCSRGHISWSTTISLSLSSMTIAFCLPSHCSWRRRRWRPPCPSPWPPPPRPSGLTSDVCWCFWSGRADCSAQYARTWWTGSRHSARRRRWPRPRPPRHCGPGTGPGCRCRRLREVNKTMYLYDVIKRAIKVKNMSSRYLITTVQ